MPDSWLMAEKLGARGGLVVQWVALAISVAGIALRCLTVAFAPDGTSSRDTRALRASGLNTAGAYSLVRHPLYLGSGLMWIGVAVSLRVWWLVVIVALGYWLYVERLMVAEEAFLMHSFPEEFPRWAARTPAFWPQLTGWRRPNLAFQFKRVSSEHNGLLGVAIAVALLQLLGSQWQGGETWQHWYSAHLDLVMLVGFATAVSTMCVIGRRL